MMLSTSTPIVIRKTPAQASSCQLVKGLMANLKIATFSNSFSKAQLVLLVGSWGCAVLVWFWVNRFDFGVLEFTFGQ